MIFLKIRYLIKEYRIKPLIKKYNDFVKIAKKNEIRLKPYSSNNYFSEFRYSEFNASFKLKLQLNNNLQASFILITETKLLVGEFTLNIKHYLLKKIYLIIYFLDNFFEAGVIIQLYLSL